MYCISMKNSTEYPHSFESHFFVATSNLNITICSTGEGVWSTPPSTPTGDPPNRNPSDGMEGDSSYEKAIYAAEKVRSWHGADSSERSGQVPRHISAVNGGAGNFGGNAPHTSTSSTGYPRIPDMGAAHKSGGPEIISPSNLHVHRGFMPSPVGGFEATKPTDLPGSRQKAVITTPPKPQTSKSGKGGSVAETRPRAKSIEEADKRRENYVPTSGGRGAKSGGQDENAFCLGSLSSLITSKEEGNVSGMMESEQDRSGARKISETSTVSVSAKRERERVKEKEM